jgi:diguanylate cyclase (GGDEF)-like protein
MNSVLFIQLVILVISLTLSVIFFIAWKSMVRKTYTLLWSIAFLIIVFQHLFNMFQGWFSHYSVYWSLVCALSISTVVLGCSGHFIRAKARINLKMFAISGVIAWLATTYFTVVDPHVGLRMSIYVYSNAIFILVTSVVIWNTRSRPNAAEMGTSATYFIFAVLQIIAGTFALMQGAEVNAEYRGYYTMVNLASLPVAFTAMGLFVVFMLAADLSEEMKELAETDFLTRCLNRRGFYDKAQLHINSTLQDGGVMALIYMDIDHFKTINDQYGHAIGDEVLKQTVDVVKRNVKHKDLMGRLGGEEFVILVTGNQESELEQIAERLREVIAAHQIQTNGQAFNISASFGVAFIKSTKTTVENAVNDADKALYGAKRKGRNQVVVAAS